MKAHILSIKTAFCLLSALLLAGNMAYAQNTLKGKVTDASGQFSVRDRGQSALFP